MEISAMAITKNAHAHAQIASSMFQAIKGLLEAQIS